MMCTPYLLGVALIIGAAQGSWAQDQPRTSTLTMATGGPAGTTAATPAAPAATSPAEVEAYVRTASKGGEMDFDKFLASRKQTMFLHNGAMYNKHEYALVLWGMRARLLGIASAERACAVYTQVSNRPLSAADKRALVSGYESGTQE